MQSHICLSLKPDQISVSHCQISHLPQDNLYKQAVLNGSDHTKQDSLTNVV